jgi:hypothetical protein
MGTMDRDITWIQTQLTMARWYLDAAVTATAESVREHVQRARQSYEGVLQSFSQLDLDGEQREQLEREVSALKARVEAAESG